MPCGCEGHADNADLCRHPQVLEDVHLALFARAPAMSAGDVALAEWEEKRRAARARLKIASERWQALKDDE